MEEIVNNFDIEDYDIVKELIPFVKDDAWKEYISNYSFTGYTPKDPVFAFHVAERIYEFLLEIWGRVADLDIILEEVEELYDTKNF